jgi:competence protein ComGC
MSKSDIIELINAASGNVEVPNVAKQKAEFYKMGVRALLAQLQIQVDLINNGDSNNG